MYVAQVLGMLDQGIDDMEAKRKRPIEEAFQKITELRDIKRNARVWRHFDVGSDL